MQDTFGSFKDAMDIVGEFFGELAELIKDCFLEEEFYKLYYEVPSKVPSKVKHLRYIENLFRLRYKSRIIIPIRNLPYNRRLY